MKRVVKLNEFFSVSVKLLEKAKDVIADTRKLAGFTGLKKGEASSDVFTLADVHIQNTVKYNLQQIYPQAKIIGEEDEVGEMNTGQPYIMPDQIDRNHISQKMLLTNYNIHKQCYREYLSEMESIQDKKTTEAAWNFFDFPDEFYEEDMVIWIDPLDGTQGFIEGHLSHITSMIGLAIGHRPRAGIIHKPFYDQELQMQRTYFGTPECGVFVKDKFPKKLKRLQRVSVMPPFENDEGVQADDYNLWLCGSMNRNQTKMDELLNSLDAVNVGRVAGSGNKIVYMLDQYADYYINLVPGFKYWDMCASEALIEAKMGICTDRNGQPLIYDEDRSDYTINEGIIIAKNLKVFNLVRDRCMKNLGMTIEQFSAEVDEDSRRYQERKRLRLQKEAEMKADENHKKSLM